MANLDLIRGRQVVIPLTNRTGATSVIGDVVVLDPANDDSYITTTTAASPVVIGVVQEEIVSLGVGRVLFVGYAALVNVGAAVTRGQFMETSASAKVAQSNATRHIGSVGQWLTGGATPAAFVWGVADGATVTTTPDLDDLGDVNAAAPTDGQVLTWDATPGEWVASTPSGGGGGSGSAATEAAGRVYASQNFR